MGSRQFIISPMTTARGPIGTFNIGLPEGVPIPDDLAEVAQTVAKILASHLELHTNIEKLERTVQQLSNAQDQLVEQAKNAALGEMLSGLAHEVNTPLSVVGNAISLASDSIDSVSSMMLEGRLTRDGFKSWKTETDHFLDLGRQNLGRAIRIMTELKSVSLEHHLDARDPVNLQDLVGRVKLLLNPFTRRHDIEIEVTGDAPTVMTSAGKLHQCLVNLIQNAAIHGYEGSGGLVSIDIEDRGRTAVILVRDSGRNMPPDVQARALEPFFTTKRGRGGTGLGLHLAATHLAELGGQLTLHSTQNEGTTFKIILPSGIPNDSLNDAMVRDVNGYIGGMNSCQTTTSRAF